MIAVLAGLGLGWVVAVSFIWVICAGAHGPSTCEFCGREHEADTPCSTSLQPAYDSYYDDEGGEA
jgi:hypothetical protein